MSRDQVPRGPEEPDDEDPEPTGRLTMTSAGAITGFGLAGLVLGWLLKPVSTSMNGTAPRVGWVPVLALFLCAAIIAGVAWSTHRSVQRQQQRLEPHQAVNRLVLAKASALAGAIVAGGYLGYALSFVGVDAELAHERVLHSLLAGLAAALTVAGSLLLERACRVRRPPA